MRCLLHNRVCKSSWSVVVAGRRLSQNPDHKVQRLLASASASASASISASISATASAVVSRGIGGRVAVGVAPRTASRKSPKLFCETRLIAKRKTSAGPLVVALLSFVPTLALAAAAPLSLTYLPPDSDHFKPTLELLKSDDGLAAIVPQVNQLLQFAEPLELLVGADDGPYYDPGTQQITLPYEFVEEIAMRFSAVDTDNPLSDEQLDTVVLDVVMHTVFHELGHALVAQYELPILASEEDAVDGLANVLLLEYFSSGEAIVSNAADMFALEDLDIDNFEPSDFWAEHSLDIQRYYSGYCHLYGFDPDGQQHIIDEQILSAERADQCIDEYTLLSQNWLQVLDGKLKTP